MKKVTIGFILGLVLSLGVTALASEVKQYILKEASYPIFVDGAEYNDREFPILNYEGSTYVPLAKLGDLTGVNYSWNDKLHRVEIVIDPNKALEIMDNSDSSDSNTSYELYIMDGKGEFLGYTMLRGYPDENKYRIYFKGGPSSYHTTVDDLRGINLNEKIKWTDGGRSYEASRKDLYKYFSDTTRYKSQLMSNYDAMLTDEWLLDTFGNVYLEWTEGFGYSSDASRWVERYFIQSGQLNRNSNVTLTPDFEINLERDDEIEGLVTSYEEDEALQEIRNAQIKGSQIHGEWVTESDLSKKADITVGIGNDINHRKIYGPYSSSKREVLYSYSLPINWTSSAQSETVINGIRMKYDQKDIFYYVEDLYDLGILPRDFNEQIADKYRK